MKTKMKMISTALPCLLLWSQAAAAADIHTSGNLQRSTAGFVGVNVSINGHQKNRGVVPTARLSLGVNHVYHENGSGMPTRSFRGSTFELGLSRTGHTDIYIGGQRYSDVKTRIGVGPVGVALLAVGGITIVGAAVAASSGSQKKQPEVVCMGVDICPPLGG